MAKRSENEHPTVFISYSHDSPEHADRVLALADRLVGDGIDCVLDQYEESPPEGWPRWMDKHIRDADFVVMVCTETYYKRVMGEEEPGKGRGVRWEGNLIYQHLYDADTVNRRFVVALFDAADEKYIPTPVKGPSYYLVNSEEGYEDLYRRLTHQPRATKAKVGKLRKLASRERKQDFFAPQVTLSKLPVTGHELFGREQELAVLDRAWGDEHTHILSLVAWGGVGKTALVNEWLNRMERDNYRGAERVFGWSFYSQGTREDRQVSGDEFIAYALNWFGDKETAESKKSAWEKGVRLAELVRGQRTLLILDGLEPLQYPPGAMEGRLKDQGLQALVKELAGSSDGLCVITTREAVKDIERFVGAAVKQVELEDLSLEAGAELLKSLGVKGTQKELGQAVKDFGGHALALSLLGTYLKGRYAGEIRKRDKIKKLAYEKQEGGRHAKRVMESYEVWLKGKPELDILYLMGLFDRPAQSGAIAALREGAAIKGLTDNLQGLSDEDWDFAVGHLRELRLLGELDEGDAGKLDCHPLVREHFGEKLKRRNPFSWKEPHRKVYAYLRRLFGKPSRSWREAHRRLYEYYKGVPEKELPETLAEMEPLFAAVGHGCQAGRYQKAFDDVYWGRILRRNDYYVVNKLGAFGAFLAVLSGFFEEAWSRPVSELKESDQTVVLSGAGLGLRALGRFREAVEPFAGAVKRFNRLKDWEQVAMNGGILSGCRLVVGAVEAAVDYGRRGVTYAKTTGDEIAMMGSRAQLANALHQAGAIREARRLFEEAEGMQKERQPEHPLLHILFGFEYPDLILNEGGYREVQKRAKQTSEWTTAQNFPLNIGLNKLSLGRAYLLEVVSGRRQKTGDRRQEGGGKKDDGRWGEKMAKAGEYLDQAVDRLREAPAQEFLVRGLLSCTEYYRYAGEYERAWGDLGEAREIAERGEMRLYMGDYYLEGARLCLVEAQECRTSNIEHRMSKEKKQKVVPFGRYEPALMGGAEILAEARKYFEKGRSEVDEMGYHRRDPELLLIEAEVLTLEGKKEEGKKTLEKAKDRINEMGFHRWDSEIQRILGAIR